MTTKSQIRGTVLTRDEGCRCQWIMTCPDTFLISRYRRHSPSPASGNHNDAIQRLLGGWAACCGGTAHHKTLIPFWLNSCKFGLHALTCGQYETPGRAASRALGLCLISRKDPRFQEWHLWTGWRLNISGIHITKFGDRIIKTHYPTKWFLQVNLTGNLDL